MDTKDKSSRSGSKTNLNESTMPLLEDLDPVDKSEKIELKEKSSTSSVGGDEKDDSRTEKQDGDKTSTVEMGEDGKPITEEPKKSKKKKEKSHKRSPSCVQTMSVGLNLRDRDEKGVNDHVNLHFEDLIAEPEDSHSFDGVWRITYIVFNGTKFWIYRLLAALLALPCAVCWGLNFALLTFCHVWAITPFIRVLELLFYFIKRVWCLIIRTLLDPVFESIGMLCSNVRIRTIHHPTSSCEQIGIA